MLSNSAAKQRNEVRGRAADGETVVVCACVHLIVGAVFAQKATPRELQLQELRPLPLLRVFELLRRVLLHLRLQAPALLANDVQMMAPRRHAPKQPKRGLLSRTRARL